MNVLTWLKQGDPVIARLVNKYLLDQDVKYIDDGYIQKYIHLYDSESKRWGHGIYSPKWISTHYTLLELKYMEIDPMHNVYQEAVKNLVDHLWIDEKPKKGHRQQDMCIVGMLIQLVTYANIHEQRNPRMMDYILDHQFDDGGWNCQWDSGRNPKISSVHTTISVLEGLHEFVKNNYTYRLEDVKKAIHQGIECLLSRDVILNKKSKQPLHPSMVKYHYPPRWKYDYLRVLELLADMKYPYDQRLDQVMTILLNDIKDGRLKRGTQIPGLIHFQLEKTTYGRFNTLRALKVLKHYRSDVYQTCTHNELKGE
jgi:hypothetical protein